MNKRSTEGCAIAVASALSILMAPGLAKATDDCSEPQQYRASNFESRSGLSRAALNRQGNLVITLDQNADNRVDRIYRIALVNAKHRSQTISRWSGDEVELRVQTWSVGDSEIHRFVPVQSKRAFIVAFRGQECLDQFISSQPMALGPIYLRTAISIHTPAALESASHESVLDSYDKEGIFRVAPGSSKTSAGEMTSRTTATGPLICMAGGEGATGCSISFGGIGGLTTGSCSVSGCEAPSFACCGPGFGSNCVCHRPDDDAGVGGGGIGDGDGSGGGSGGDSGGGAGGSDDDECGQADPPPSCESDGDGDEVEG